MFCLHLRFPSLLTGLLCSSLPFSSGCCLGQSWSQDHLLSKPDLLSSVRLGLPCAPLAFLPTSQLFTIVIHVTTRPPRAPTCLPCAKAWSFCDRCGSLRPSPPYSYCVLELHFYFVIYFNFFLLFLCYFSVFCFIILHFLFCFVGYLGFSLLVVFMV
jgi:hypothetical protein